MLSVVAVDSNERSEKGLSIDCRRRQSRTASVVYTDMEKTKPYVAHIGDRLQ